MFSQGKRSYSFVVLSLILLALGCAGQSATTDNGQTTPATDNPTTPSNTTPSTTPTNTAPTTGEVKVDVTYSGKRQLTGVAVLLVDAASYPCANINFASLPQALTQQEIAGASGTTTFASLSGGKSVRVLAVSRNTNGHAVARSCYDAPVTVVAGQSQSVVVDLSDIAAKIKGNFDVTYSIDLVSGLPEEVRNVVDGVVNTIKNPGNQLVDWVCQVEALKDYCESEAIRKLIGDLATTMIQKYLSENKDLNWAYYSANDIVAMLKEFKLTGKVVFGDTPDAQGNFPAGVNKQNLENISYRWTYGAECDPANASCGVNNLPVSDAGMSKEPVEFTARLLNLDELHVEPYSIKFEYGQLLGHLVETVILPKIFGDDFNSYENVIKRILGGAGCVSQGNCCENFATSMKETLFDSDTAYTLALTGCGIAAQKGAEMLRDQFAKLDSKLAEGLTFSSSKEGCKLIDSDDNMEFDGIGTADAPCQLNASVKIGESSYTVKASLLGVRK